MLSEIAEWDRNYTPVEIDPETDAMHQSWLALFRTDDTPLETRKMLSRALFTLLSKDPHERRVARPPKRNLRGADCRTS